MIEVSYSRESSRQDCLHMSKSNKIIRRQQWNNNSSSSSSKWLFSRLQPTSLTIQLLRWVRRHPLAENTRCSLQHFHRNAMKVKNNKWRDTPRLRTWRLLLLLMLAWYRNQDHLRWRLRLSPSIWVLKRKDPTSILWSQLRPCSLACIRNIFHKKLMLASNDKR